MKAIVALALAALASAHAISLADDTQALRRRDFQPVDLNFQAGPVTYDLKFVADGQEHFTNNDLNVNLITAPDFDAYHLCTFKTAGGEVTLAPSLTKRPGDFWPVNQIAVGPPQKIISVTCSGTCVTVYGECYNSTTGQETRLGT
ncbi:hypothetical protein KVR01_001683 [Diaporthe batatas]|uniref:uncharacterized protein n=1 Tax=Diaporthe batatas TaxID=748121 RepID=UPI001D04BD01|nr:uncharacterized protein KVR01_001683 [Diaporthe batatas]KAG8168934.1 hypothetical protein KVR01_001683 [Diaporthe batatas]